MSEITVSMPMHEYLNLLEKEKALKALAEDPLKTIVIDSDSIINPTDEWRYLLVRLESLKEENQALKEQLNKTIPQTKTFWR